MLCLNQDDWVFLCYVELLELHLFLHVKSFEAMLLRLLEFHAELIKHNLGRIA